MPYFLPIDCRQNFYTNIQRFNMNPYKELDNAYKEPREFLGVALCEFNSTTNPAFSNRIGLVGTVALPNPTCCFTGDTLRSSMHTSYVIRVTFNKATRELYVHTRNSVYCFLMSISFEKEDYTWSLPEDLRQNYEGLIQELEASQLQ